MFGYLRLYKDTLTLQQRKIYRDYYCSSCLALKQNYGRVARFLLSYDIGYVALILFPRTMKLEPCGNCGKHIANPRSCFQQEYWKKIAMYEMLLVRMKLIDNVYDSHHKFFPHCLEGVFCLVFRKVNREAQPFLPYFTEYLRQEHLFQDYAEAERSYLLFMRKLLWGIFDGPEENLLLVLMLARWVYLIDAIDDYGEDLKNGSFNLFQLNMPLYSSKAKFVSEESERLYFVYQKIYIDILNVYHRCTFNKQQTLILNNLIFESIPKITKSIMNGEKLIHEKILKN